MNYLKRLWGALTGNTYVEDFTCMVIVMEDSQPLSEEQMEAIVENMIVEYAENKFDIPSKVVFKDIR